MNETIKEFAKQAGFCADVTVSDGQDNHIVTKTEQSLEKFAELIVRECAKLVEDNLDPCNAWITLAYIKEHFGVEE